MPQAVDVGSVLGGRYKVTAYVLASAEKDLVLDGVDQVLNRAVSILVASPSNASQVATSAREVATGERAGNIQVLDLGITDSGTYLVTNRAPAADLLDLVIQREAAPYIEPFFTDTLGSEIFGVPRSTEPETYDDDDEYDDYQEREPRRSRLPKARMPRFGRGAAAGGAAAAGAAGAAAAGTSPGQSAPGTAPQQTRSSQTNDRGASVPPPPSAPPRVTSNERSAQPKVEEWSEDRYSSQADERSGRPASRFPAAAAGAHPVSSQDYDDEPDSYDDYDDDRENNPRFTRLLVGVVLALVIIGAVVFAVTQLRPIISPPAANEQTTSQEATETTEGQSSTPSEAQSSEPAPELIPPVATNVTRLVPGNPELNSQTDGELGAIIDGNPASFWSSLVYANETFGGLAQNLALVVELEESSSITQIEIEQLNSSGGNFTVSLNDEPILEGATQVAQSGFTGPSVTFNVPEVDGVPPTARYVIVNFTQLPRLTNVQAQYPWGMRIAEINVS